MFLYIMQSNQKSANEIYIPVYAAGPVKSPLNFNQIISAVKDTNAQNIISKAFGKLSQISIQENLVWIDSPEILSVVNQNGGNDFSANHNDKKVDFILLPGKSLEENNITASAVWIVNFYSQNESLVLLIDAVSGKFIGKLSQ